MKTGVCPKCKKHKDSTSHHILPKCHYGDGDTIEICRACHDKLEKLILVFEGKKRGKRNCLPKNMYYIILKFFLYENDDRNRLLDKRDLYQRGKTYRRNAESKAIKKRDRKYGSRRSPYVPARTNA